MIAAVAVDAQDHQLDFMLIGGQAVLLHGVPRLTQGIDVTVGVTPDEVDLLLDLCAAIPLEPLPEDPVRFARKQYVLPAIDRRTRIRVDFISHRSRTSGRHLAARCASASGAWMYRSLRWRI